MPAEIYIVFGKVTHVAEDGRHDGQIEAVFASEPDAELYSSMGDMTIETHAVIPARKRSSRETEETIMTEPQNATWQAAKAARESVVLGLTRLEQWYGALALEGDLADIYNGETEWVLDEPARVIRAELHDAIVSLTTIMIAHKNDPADDSPAVDDEQAAREGFRIEHEL